jgi:hypothetical protein
MATIGIIHTVKYRACVDRAYIYKNNLGAGCGECTPDTAEYITKTSALVQHNIQKERESMVF